MDRWNRRNRGHADIIKTNRDIIKMNRNVMNRDEYRIKIILGLDEGEVLQSQFRFNILSIKYRIYWMEN